jgi:hypothetical protein
VRYALSMLEVIAGEIVEFAASQARSRATHSLDIGCLIR